MADKAIPKYDAFVVTNREGQDAYWTKVGAAWPTKSGDGLVVQLAALPPDGRLTLLPYKPPPKKE